LKDADSCTFDELLHINDALIRFYFKENPDTLSDDQYAQRIKELRWLAEEGLTKPSRF
jgi:hypothetical protein